MPAPNCPPAAVTTPPEMEISVATGVAYSLTQTGARAAAGAGIGIGVSAAFAGLPGVKRRIKDNESLLREKHNVH